MLTLCGNPVNFFHVWAKRLGDNNASIGLLEIFQNSDHGSSNGEAGSIKCVYKFYLAAPLAPESNGRPPGLKIFKVATGRYLSVRILPGKPHLKVVSLGRREPQIRRTE